MDEEKLVWQDLGHSKPGEHCEERPGWAGALELAQLTMVVTFGGKNGSVKSSRNLADR